MPHQGITLDDIGGTAGAQAIADFLEEGDPGVVIRNWADPNSESWDLFDEQVAEFWKPTAVWVQKNKGGRH